MSSPSSSSCSIIISISSLQFYPPSKNHRNQSRLNHLYILINMSSPVAMNYFSKAQSEFKPPLIANENAFLGDVFTSEKENPQAPISMGFYRLEKGSSIGLM